MVKTIHMSINMCSFGYISSGEERATRPWLQGSAPERLAEPVSVRARLERAAGHCWSDWATEPLASRLKAGPAPHPGACARMPRPRQRLRVACGRAAHAAANLALVAGTPAPVQQLGIGARRARSQSACPTRRLCAAMYAIRAAASLSSSLRFGIASSL